jgi:hypothetical protein
MSFFFFPLFGFIIFPLCLYVCMCFMNMYVFRFLFVA